jgi:glycine oxidase
MPDFIVIGGGLIGMLTTRELLCAGQRVILLEQTAPGREASWAGGGIISPLYPWRYAAAVTDLASLSQQSYADLSRALERESGVDPEYTASGLLILEAEDADDALRWHGKTAQPMDRLNAQDITTCEPALSTAAETAIWMPSVAQIRNPRLVKAALGAIERRVEIRRQTRVERLLTAKGRIIGVKTAGETLSADRVIVCAGAWSAQLLQEFLPCPRIEPVLGQMILLRSRPGAIRRIVLHQDRYVIPRRDGRVLVGSTLEYRGFHKQTTRAAREALTDFALQRFPILKQARVERHWAGLRPGSPNGIPYIGPVPEIDGLYVNAGHFRNGVVLAPASARLITDLALGREPRLSAEPYALDAPRD